MTKSLHSDLARFSDAINRVVEYPACPDVSSILDIGFGSSNELRALISVFSSARLLAIDSDPRVIERYRARPLQTGSENIEIEQLDARHLTTDDVSRVDLVVIRHANFHDPERGWAANIPHIVGMMRNQSIVIISVYSLNELELAMELVERNSVELITGAPYSSFPVGLDGGDRHIAAYIRKF